MRLETRDPRPTTPMLPPSEVVIRLLLAAALGSVIGLERERLLWAAGLRTHMLVSVGSTLVMIVSAYGFAGVVNTPGVSLDPSRVAAQVVSGIGFLGAGTILLRQEVIRGLTTAASLWAVAAIGLAVGGGLYFHPVHRPVPEDDRADVDAAAGIGRPGNQAGFDLGRSGE